METMKVRSHIGADGILEIQMPTDFKDTSVEMVLVVQPLSHQETTASEEPQVQYNAWGKPTTKKSRSHALAFGGSLWEHRSHATITPRGCVGSNINPRND